MLRSCPLDDGVALRFDVCDHLQHQFQPLQLAQQFGLQPGRQGAPVTSSQTSKLRLAVGPQGSVIIHAVECVQAFDAVDMLDPLTDEPLALAMQSLGVLFLDARNAHHTAGIRFAAQIRPSARCIRSTSIPTILAGFARRFTSRLAGSRT